MPRTRQQAASKIASDSIAQLTSVFDALPEKPRETYTLREAVSQLYQPIRTALSRGYHYDEIAVILAEQGIAISAFSLKRYLSLSKGEQTQTSQSGQGKRRGRQPKAAVEATAEPLEATAEPSEPATATVQPELAPKRRGRPKVAASGQPGLEEPDTVPANPQPEAEAAPKRRGRTSKTAAKAKPAPRTTTRTAKGRGRKLMSQ
ncbi:hypothetical protein [Leptolyngbya sp. FACHB-711]|uniref:hypothetical protein n=1 Tax=unclassified Leptolyngbya TaxID=2650499 RepID=UPI0016891E3D|nr:hypothetical protein [Leptolyngbya sp. FACHB-711]MBD2026326.1 hypothetical protein [Leptolyngbya sp. FACHB-711]